MKWASALSNKPHTLEALAEALDALEAELAGVGADLVVAFVSTEHNAWLEEASQRIADRFPTACRVGCTGGGVIGAGQEVEDGPALALVAARLPGVALSVVHVDEHELPSQADAKAFWQDRLGEAAPSGLLLFADAFTIEADQLVAGLDAAYPRAPKVGGLASGGIAPGEHRLLAGDDIWRSGAVAVGLSGDVAVETVVAQGCKPIGKPMLITRCQGNAVFELDGKSPLEVLQGLYAELGEADRELFTHSLFVGVEMKDDAVEYRQGDFLIRHLLGIDPDRGMMVIADQPRPYQVIQFHLRDAQTASEDLARRLQRYTTGGGRPGGALLFSCLGRGEHLFGLKDHDSRLFRQLVGEIPVGGFFCNGEIGPVGGKTFLHGYTSAFALFSPRARSGN